MTEEQKIELCKIYNNSDIDSLYYMMPFCDQEQKELLNRLIELNTMTTIGWGEKSCTEEEQDAYYDGNCWVVLALKMSEGMLILKGNFINKSTIRVMGVNLP